MLNLNRTCLNRFAFDKGRIGRVEIEPKRVEKRVENSIVLLEKQTGNCSRDLRTLLEDLLKSCDVGVV